MSRFFLSSLLCLSGLLLGSAQAADLARGKELAATVCAACHGADGNSTIAQNPRLAGQHASYLARALHDYKSGARNNPVMAGMAAGLSDADIEAVSAWFASQTGLVAPH